jgi:cysteine desulfurase
MTSGIYLDYNATAPLRPQAREVMLRAWEIGGNPSSVHAAGRAARAIVEQAREQVAALMGGPASIVVFTSGGTEASALAIDSAVAAGSKRLIISAIEHECVLETAKASGMAVEILPVTQAGTADLAWLQARLSVWDPAEGKPFVALMLANNETGIVQPVQAASEIVRGAEGWLHVDAVQAAGKIAMDSRALGADTLAVSAHKLGGPQGVGALTFGPRATLVRRQHGGGQERGRRAGTENVAGIAGFGAAASAAMTDINDNSTWRDAAARKLTALGGVVVGEASVRLPNTLCVAMPGQAADLQVMSFDLAGVQISAGSACSSGKVKASHVLTAMGLHEVAGCTIRVSGGWATTEADWQAFVSAWTTLQSHARQRASAA